MNKVERESFLKSFFLFFVSLGALIAVLLTINYQKELQSLDERLLTEMRVCSFDLQCEHLEIGFIPQNTKELYILYKDEKGLHSYYPIPNTENYHLHLHLPQERYGQELHTLKSEGIQNFFMVLFVVFIFSILFSIYVLYPLRNALHLTQEFVKDILHDFNTPLSALRLNSAMLQKEFGNNEKVQRIEQSVSNILALQEHLYAYLSNHTLQKELFDLDEVLSREIAIIEKNYPTITFVLEKSSQQLWGNKEAFARIIENILTNAAKYNKPKGSVSVYFKAKKLSIIDTGKGIKKPQHIFDRFYKEQDRGIGIGLHIVQKLSDEMGIRIEVESAVGKGSAFILDLSELTDR